MTRRAVISAASSPALARGHATSLSSSGRQLLGKRTAPGVSGFPAHQHPNQDCSAREQVKSWFVVRFAEVGGHHEACPNRLHHRHSHVRRCGLEPACGGDGRRPFRAGQISIVWSSRSRDRTSERPLYPKSRHHRKSRSCPLSPTSGCEVYPSPVRA